MHPQKNPTNPNKNRTHRQTRITGQNPTRKNPEAGPERTSQKPRAVPQFLIKFFLENSKPRSKRDLRDYYDKIPDDSRSRDRGYQKKAKRDHRASYPRDSPRKSPKGKGHYDKRALPANTRPLDKSKTRAGKSERSESLSRRGNDAKASTHKNCRPYRNSERGGKSSGSLSRYNGKNYTRRNYKDNY
jgi:hypothetical protein